MTKRRRKLGNTLLAAFLIIAILGSIGGIVASSSLKYVDSEYSDALQNYGFAQGDIGQAMLRIAQAQAATVKIVSYTNKEEIAEAQSNVQMYKQEYLKKVEEVQKTLSDENAQEIFSRINAMTEEYTVLQADIAEQGNTTDATLSRTAQDRLETELDPLYREFYGTWEELANYKSTKGDSESDRLSNVGRAMLLISIVVIVLSIVIACIFAVMVSRDIGKPVRESSERLVKFAKGDFKSPVPEPINNDETKDLIDATGDAISNLNRVITDIDYQLGEMGHGNFDVASRDEGAYVGDLASILESIKSLNAAVNDVLLQVDASVEQVNAGGEQVSSGAQALAQGSTEQASSVEELAATINDISNQINATAGHAKTAEDEDRTAGEELGVCSKHMDDLVAAMQVIDGKSQEISKVIKTIEDIAFQTNILALNAAVEAARAGAAGKGFAVVADEVRNLATKSQQAAQSTTVLIDETVKAVAEGTRLSGETDQSLRRVVDNSQKVLEAVTLISSATAEQSSAVGQVSVGIDQISAVVQTNSATAEQSAAASEELSGQASLLKELVGKFTLRRSSGPVGAAAYAASGSGGRSESSFGGSDKY